MWIKQCLACGLAITLWHGQVLWAQNYPVKAIRIVAAAAGGSSDFSARLIAQGISGPLGQPVVVENRGGTGVIAAQTVARSAPDGYTLLNYGSNVWLLPFLQGDLHYDPIRDFAPITLAIRSPNILVVHPSLPVKSVRELIALAKAYPGGLNYASGGDGSSNHLAGELFNSIAGVKLVRVPYKGVGPAISDLLSGHVQVMFATAGGTAQHIKSGRLRALAVTSLHQTALAPGLPTAAASGLPGYEATSIQAVFAPSGTPGPVIARLNQEIVRVLNQPEVKERLFNSGVEAVGSSPEELAATIKAEMSRLGKVIREAGIRVK